jgi:predicted transcriptional regulator
MPQSTVGLRLDAETQERLKALGAARDRSPHYLMKQAVERYLAAEETIQAERELIAARWERYELTGETLDHDEVATWAAGLVQSDTPDTPITPDSE